MKDNTIQIGDLIKVLWAMDNREYSGKVIDIRGNIALIEVKNFLVYVMDSNRLLKIPSLDTDLLTKAS